MNLKPFLLVLVLSCFWGVAMAQENQSRQIRLAELGIDPAQADAFAAATREVGQASVRSEEGCLAL
jgi:hypothetical protein